MLKYIAPAPATAATPARKHRLLLAWCPAQAIAVMPIASSDPTPRR